MGGSRLTTNTHLTVAAVVERHGRFLVVEELVSGRQVINQPAGHVEHGETHLEAVVREMLEETAWCFDPAAIVGAYLWTHPDSGERFLRVAYSGKVHGHDASRQLDEGILRTMWLSRDELLERKDQLRSPMVIRAIDDYQAGVRFPRNLFQQLDFEELADRAVVV
jgi:8-oxo-dGTP pyrophosphatase MutT (NUDIX family)